MKIQNPCASELFSGCADIVLLVRQPAHLATNCGRFVWTVLAHERISEAMLSDAILQAIFCLSLLPASQLTSN